MPLGPGPRAAASRPAGRRAPGLTCVADDDVLEEIGVRHGRGRSVPGHIGFTALTERAKAAL